ncbi:MAG: leucine-rich repeat protein [Prevotella sp.]|nr:leucine-rich repeat protein [Prevotella sp.]
MGRKSRFEIDGIYYNLITKAKQAEVTNGGTTGQYSGNIVIPSSVTYEGVTYSVTTIYSEAFSNCYSLTRITIPNSVTSIGSSAFEGCSRLTSVTIPNSVTSIGSYAFEGCSRLTSVTIPSSVTSIGSYVFSYCSSLTSVTIPNSVTSIGSYAFYNCSSLASVTIPNSVSYIDVSTFYKCTSLATVSIPNTIIAIGGYAFYGCTSLTSVEIPNSVKYIGGSAFYECNELKEVSLGSGVINIGTRSYYYDDEGNYHSLNNNGNSFALCKNLETVKCLAESVPTTNANTFDQSLVEYATLCVSEGSIDSYKTTEPWSSFGTIKSLTDDGSNDPILFDGIYFTFDEENGTATVVAGDVAYTGEVVIPSTVTYDGKEYSVTAIAEKAFQGCSGLTSVYIPESVAAIGEYAFDGCGNLTSVTVAWETPVVINSTVFSNSGNATLYVPIGTEATYKAADHWKAFNQIVGLDDDNGQVSIDNIYYSFDTENYNATVTGAAEGMTEVNIPDFVVHDGKTYAVTAIAKEAFMDHGMTSVVVPYTMTDIGYDAFRGCKNLTSMAVEDYHSYLVQLAPPRVEGLVDVDGTKDPAAKRAQGDLRVYGDADGNGAYDSRNGCNAIIRTANNTLVAGCQTTVIPDDVETIYDHAFYGHTNLKAIDIPASVKAIRSGAFYGCTGLETVTFNEGLEAIDNYAFYGCSKLTTLYIPSTVTSIDLNAFKNCTGLAKVVAPDIAAWCAISFGKDANPLANAEHLYIDENTEVTELAIPQGVTAVGNYAFYNAKAITSVTIPATVTELGGYAFYGCDNLTSVTVAWAEPITIGSSRFSNRANAILYVPTGTKALYEAADYWKEFKEIHEVAIDGTVLIDGIYYALDGTSGTATVVSGDNTYTGSVTIPAQIEYGGVTYPVTAIGIKAFQGCGELTSIDIPSSIVTIDDYAFQGCSSLAEVNIPASVTTLGGYVFDSCDNLASVTVNWTDAGSIPAIGKSRFPNRANMTLYVPKGTKALYEAADYWKEFKEIVEMEDDTIEVTDISEMDNAIYIEPLEARAGETVALDIQMKNTLSPVGCTFRLTLPEGFSLQKDEDGDLVYEMGSRAKKMSVVYMASDGRTFDFSLTPLSGTATITGTEGTFITLQLEVPEGTPTGNYEILLTRNLIESKDDTNMTIENALTDIVSAVTITDYLLGDVNGDGNVTPADAIMILYHYFGVEQTGFIFKAADVNGDGNITPADAIEVLYIYFNAGRSNSPAFTNQTLDPQ